MIASIQFSLRCVWLALALIACGAKTTRPPAPAPFRPPETSLRGSVLDARAQTPLNGIRIYTTPSTAVAISASDGGFVLRSAAFRQGILYRVTAEGPGYAPLTVEANGLQPGKDNALPPFLLTPGGHQSPAEPPDLSQEPEEPRIQPPMLDP